MDKETATHSSCAGVRAMCQEWQGKPQNSLVFSENSFGYGNPTTGLSREQAREHPVEWQTRYWQMH